MTLRILLNVTHLLGVGHLNRAAALARALAAAGHDVTLASGGLPSPLLNAGTVRVVQLAPVKVAGTAFSRLLDPDGAPASPAYLAARREALLDVLAAARPDVVITELFPFGRRALAEENLALVEAAGNMDPRPAILASVRDVLVASSKPERIAETHRILRDRYDAVLVHGDPTVLPLEASWPLVDDIRPLLRYTGYIDDASAASDGAGADGCGAILVSGGGSAASLPLYRSAVAAAREIIDRPWRLLIGAGVGEADFAALRAEAPPHVTVERARPDFPALLARAAVAISQFGYNTAVDLLRAGTRAVVVPFEAGGETEQRLRAERFSREGLLTLVPQADLTPDALARAIRAALAAPPPPSASIDRGGLARSVGFVEEIAAERHRQPCRTSRGGPWRQLDDALKARADAGQPLLLWWRDDDATTPTPALERLLAMAERHQMPLALAAIPAGATPALSELLRDAPAVNVLVHGFAHHNHAPADAKKAEFGDHRPAAALAEDARAALALARERFGDKLVPAFVPPWNRLAPALVTALPALGYRGLSTFGRRKPAAGLVVVNTHCDPIDWHGHRGLVDEDALLAQLAVQIEQAPADEPIGLLTHHLVHREAVWSFCERLLERLGAATVVRSLSASELFSSP
jgi:predicted glycosyltransferase